MLGDIKSLVQMVDQNIKRLDDMNKILSNLNSSIDTLASLMRTSVDQQRQLILMVQEAKNEEDAQKQKNKKSILKRLG